MNVNPLVAPPVPSTLNPTRTLNPNAKEYSPFPSSTMTVPPPVAPPVDTPIEINWLSANLGARAHTFASHRVKTGNIFEGRIQNLFSSLRTLDSCLSRTFRPEQIDRFDILCHQEVFMEKDTDSGVGNWVGKYGQFDVASKQTGHTWACHHMDLQKVPQYVLDNPKDYQTVQPPTPPPSPTTTIPRTLNPNAKEFVPSYDWDNNVTKFQLFHGTTVAWNREKFSKVDFVIGTGKLKERSTSWVILESSVNPAIQIAVTSIHAYVDGHKNSKLWADLQTDINKLKSKGYPWILVAGDFNKDYTTDLSADTSVNLVGGGSSRKTNYNASFYDSTHHPSANIKNTYAHSPTKTENAVDFQFVVGKNVEVSSHTHHEHVFSKHTNTDTLLKFNTREEMVSDYDHCPISSRIILSPPREPL